MTSTRTSLGLPDLNSLPHTHPHDSSSSAPPLTLTLDHVSPVTRLLEKRQLMLSVQSELDSHKETYLSREDLFKRREENLRRKDLELQEALVLFNKFLKENESKRRRADFRAGEEIKKKLKWEKEIYIKRIQLNKLREKYEKLRELYKENEIYQIYLQQVFDENGQHFDEINSIIHRYNTLKATNLDLIRRQTNLLAENEKERMKYSLFKKDEFNKNLSSNNEIAIYSKELEESVKRKTEIEELLIMDEKEEALRKRQTTQIILSADNLYHRCRRVLAGIRKHSNVQKLKISTATPTMMLMNNNNNTTIGNNDNNNNNNSSNPNSNKNKPYNSNNNNKNNKEIPIPDSNQILKDETIAKLHEISVYIDDFKEIVGKFNGGQNYGKFLNYNGNNNNGNNNNGNNGNSSSAAGGGVTSKFSKDRDEDSEDTGTDRE